MARVCDVCGKGPVRGYNVSHANNRTKRLWLPNLQRVRVKSNGKTVIMKVCTKCIKSKKIEKAL